jgi:CubicO group peptidase (beta-lactamase class C family)
MGTATPLSELHAELEERVAEAAQRTEVPGVVVGLLLDGAEDYVSYGVTSIPNPLPVDEGTLFQIGSTGKTLTGTAMMALVERGVVDLAAPVRRYLPELQLQDEQVAANITVLQLLNHTAGWSGDFFADTGYGADALARYIERLPGAQQEFPLGERVSYNNSALTVAGRVIEVVTGQEFETAIRELVFEPLGLTEHFYFPWEVMTRRFAVGHTRVGGELRVTPWYESRSGHPQGGGIAASARDQLRYARFHMGDGAGVLRRETLRQMQTQTTPASSNERFGVSWALRELNGVQIVAHGGSTLGHQSAFEMVPERNFALTALTNARHGNELLHELTEWIFAAYLGLAEPVPDPLQLSAAQLAEYLGTYSASTGDLHVSVDVDNERLLATPHFNPEMLAEMGVTAEEIGSDPMPMVILPDNEYLVVEGQYKGMRGALLRDAGGRVSGIDMGRVFTRRD